MNNPVAVFLCFTIVGVLVYFYWDIVIRENSNGCGTDDTTYSGLTDIPEIPFDMPGSGSDGDL